jgi:hypothetical protein
MKFALVNEQRQEAQPHLSGKCPTCGHPMVAKCGEVKIWHWAHQGSRPCDPWWENETEWHRAWKGQFPVNWQEVVHQAENGEKHIADVKTDHGWVIEFQHSYIKPEERRSRDTFYPKLVWVVDGARRKRDVAQFINAWNKGVLVGVNTPVRMVSSGKCVLLREWVDSRVPVFFDFGGNQLLCWLLASRPDGRAYIALYSRTEFIGIHRGGATQMANDFDQFVADIMKLIENYERAQASNRTPQQPILGFQHYLTRRDKHRRRF